MENSRSRIFKNFYDSKNNFDSTDSIDKISKNKSDIDLSLSSGQNILNDNSLEISTHTKDNKQKLPKLDMSEFVMMDYDGKNLHNKSEPMSIKKEALQTISEMSYIKSPIMYANN
jgi:hypothetical protein